jgi:hypothetical protein
MPGERQYRQIQEPSPWGPALPANSVSSTANAAAVRTLPAATDGTSNCIDGLMVSYTSAPTNGLLTIEDGTGNIVFRIDITSGGPQYIMLRGFSGSPNTPMIITLAAGGGSDIGRINVLNPRYAHLQ